MEHSWLLWFLIAVVLFIIEIVNLTFFVVCFAVGALAASLVSLVVHGEHLFQIQLSTFAVVTFLSFLAIRPLAEKFIRSGKSFKTNFESLENAEGLVTRDIGPGIKPGRILIRGDSWRAISQSGEFIPKDAEVQVVRLESVKLYVKRIHQQEGVHA